MELIRSGININFVGRRNIAIAGSLVLIALSFLSLFLKGGPLYGIDFAGGTLVQVHFSQTPETALVRSVLAEKGFGTAVIQLLGEGNVSIRLKGELEDSDRLADDIFTSLADKFGSGNVSLELVEAVGPQVGADMRRKGMLAIIYALVGILIYITFRFQFRFALGAVIALVHDVIITVGFFSFLNKDFTLTVVAAFLTLIGFSVNDTIVVYDRIRENIRKNPKEKLAKVVNDSINQTLSRTILTSGTVLLVALSLFLLGGEVVHDFAFALIIGVITGTYSSIYIASPIVLMGGKAEGAAGGALRGK